MALQIKSGVLEDTMLRDIMKPKREMEKEVTNKLNLDEIHPSRFLSQLEAVDLRDLVKLFGKFLNLRDSITTFRWCSFFGCLMDVMM